MKSLMMSLILALSFSAYSAQSTSCVNLAGLYKCTVDGQSADLMVEQTEIEGVAIYYVGGFEAIADGQAYDLPDSDSMNNTKYVATCDQNELKVVITGDFIDENKNKFGNLDLTEVASLDSNGGLSIVDTGNIKMDSGDTYPINDQMTCARQ